jgi:hypothetical protein
MKSPSSTTKFSGCTKRNATILDARAIIAGDLTAIGGMLSAAPPAAMDRVLSSTMTGAQARDQRVVQRDAQMTAAVPMALDTIAAAPAALLPIVAPRKAAPATGRVPMVRRSAPASTSSRKTQAMTLPDSRAL